MAAAFPLSPVPSHYRTCSFPAGARSGIFSVGGIAPSITIPSSGPNAYEVRDYWGAVVSSGSMTGTSCTPTPPAGGWKPGWYRIYLTGASTDTLFGPSHGATNFVVIRNDARFPANPAIGTYDGAGGESRDIVTKALMGLGTGRLLIANTAAPNTAGADTLSVVVTDTALSKAWWSVPTHTAFDDPARPRDLWVNFPNQSTDSLNIPNTGGGAWLRALVANPTIDGSTVFITVTAGTSSGKKITVAFPNAATIVETYDNVVDTNAAAAATLINTTSAYIRVFTVNNGTCQTLASTAIGRSYWNGVVQVVTALYPDVKYYEGPVNEPALNAETAHRMRLFQASVHAGNVGAKAIGPCPVDIGNLTNWRAFLAAGGGDYCDEFAFHDYNSMTNATLPMARQTIPEFLALLAEFGYASRPMWQTEAGAAFISVYGVMHPRRARVKIFHTLIWEQYGIPRERNCYWYDMSHGFWSFPTWWENGDTSLNPDAPLHRTLAEETFGMTHETALSFGHIGDNIFLGSIYSGAGGRVAVLVATSHMDDATITLSVDDALTAVTVVDGFGNTSTVPVNNGQAVIPVADIPTYVRIPAGSPAPTVHACNDWPPMSAQAAWVSSSPHAEGYLGSVPAHTRVLGDDKFPRAYGGTQLGYTSSTAALPETAILIWETSTRVDRVIVWCGQAWQLQSTLVDFDIQTSVDGTTWVTQETVTKPTPTSFHFGTSSTNAGCQRETYWDEQWVFDVPLPDPVTCKALRIYARATSYGGEPDPAAIVTGGQGDSNQRLVLQEVAVLCDKITTPEWVAGG